LNSPHSPRIVTSARNGKPHDFIIARVFGQLPTPLDCISSTARAPPSHAPAASPIPYSSVVSGTARIAGSSWHSSIRRRWPASGT
jgi:hypothetical protein